ncbi:hypothetical protein [Herbiconiux liangxiaofengii]|uniref:hypothetical protein n=1 Tax=Herbiconiux liangxiaofengii TaxID=3342795 RepID=UPI0035BB97EE
MSRFYRVRGIEDDHFWVAQEIEGILVETPWRVELESDGYRLSHADSAALTRLVFELGPFPTADLAVARLEALTLPD